MLLHGRKDTKFFFFLFSSSTIVNVLLYIAPLLLPSPPLRSKFCLQSFFAVAHLPMPIIHGIISFTSLLELHYYCIGFFTIVFQWWLSLYKIEVHRRSVHVVSAVPCVFLCTVGMNALRLFLKIQKRGCGLVEV